MTRYWQPGNHILLREMSRGQVWSGRPYTIVEDIPSRLVLYAGAGVRWMRPARPEGTNLRMREPTWILKEDAWYTEALRIVTPGSRHSVLLLWTVGFEELLLWYVNLEDPLVRTPIGFDYLDQAPRYGDSPGPVRVAMEGRGRVRPGNRRWHDPPREGMRHQGRGRSRNRRAGRATPTLRRAVASMAARPPLDGPRLSHSLERPPQVPRTRRRFLRPAPYSSDITRFRCSSIVPPASPLPYTPAPWAPLDSP